MMKLTDAHSTALVAAFFFSILSELVTSIPQVEDEPHHERGPRKEFNETGRYLYKNPNQGNGMLLCKQCSNRTLMDGTFKFEQQWDCIKKNVNQPGLNGTAPFCNVGKDLSCGPPPFNLSNAHWVCDPGYSDKIHSVYSTCRLLCNVTNTVIRKIYCMEMLKWHVNASFTEDCKGPFKEEGDKEMVLIVVILGGIVVIVVVGMIAVYCVCKRRKNSRPSTPVQEKEEEKIFLEDLQNKSSNTGQITPLSDSIGHCSIVADAGETEKLLETNVDEKPLKVTISTSTSNLNDYGLKQKNHSNSTGYHSAEDNEHISDHQCGEGSTPSSEHSRPISSPHSGEQNSDSGGISGLSNLSASTNSSGTRRSEESNNGAIAPLSDGNEENDLNLRIFSPSTRTSNSGLDNLRLQNNAYRLWRGSQVYFVPSKCDVLTLIIERKDDGAEFRGVLVNIGYNIIILTLESVIDEDAGVFRWTMTRRISGVEREFRGTVELFVGEPDPEAVDYAEAIRRGIGTHTESERVQRSIVEQARSLNGNDDPVQQRLDTERLPPSRGNDEPVQQLLHNERLPPDGAENNTQQVSGQVNPLIAGARPKTNHTGVMVQQSATVVSRNSYKGVQDEPAVRQLDSNTISNNLNILEKKSKNDLNQFNSPRNISSNDNNVFSLEDNAGHDSDTDHVNEQRTLSEPVTPSLKVDSILESQANQSLSINEQSKGVSIEGRFASENPTDSLEIPMNVLDELKSTEPHLDFSEVLSSQTSRTDHRDDISDNQANVQDNINNNEGQILTQTRSLSHLNPNTIDRDAHRPEPSGRSEQPYFTENHHIDDETRVKDVYSGNADIRGERSPENSSTFNQPLARRYWMSSEVARPEQATTTTYNADTGLAPVHRPRVAPAREIPEPLVGAVGGCPEVDAHRQIQAERIQEPLECITQLTNLRDLKCLQNLSYLANPRDKYGDARSWFGLALFYGQPRHFLEAIGFALRERIHDGAMNYMVTDTLANEGFTIGHLVRYFTLPGSNYKQIVDLLIDNCEDHVNCRYCQELRISRLQR